MKDKNECVEGLNNFVMNITPLMKELQEGKTVLEDYEREKIVQFFLETASTVNSVLYEDEIRHLRARDDEDRKAVVYDRR